MHEIFRSKIDVVITQDTYQHLNVLDMKSILSVQVNTSHD